MRYTPKLARCGIERDVVHVLKFMKFMMKSAFFNWQFAAAAVVQSAHVHSFVMSATEKYKSHDGEGTSRQRVVSEGRVKADCCRSGASHAP